MGEKVHLPLEGGFYTDWNRKVRRQYAPGDECYLTDGTHELYGPYAIDAVRMGTVILDCGATPPPLPDRRVWAVGVGRRRNLVLADEGVIPRDLSGELADLAGFRNVLAHIYWKLNLEEAYSILHNDLQYLIEYEHIIKEMLKRESQP